MGKLTEATKKEFAKAGNIIKGNSEEQQLAIEETLASIKSLDQEF